jgi:hypothetical protein
MDKKSNNDGKSDGFTGFPMESNICTHDQKSVKS